ncbi:uncharacterized protein LOC124365213 isoform X1 [Homalodisca vitripennis]|uniref:uncharacterized protein LOC124365213 isoform X1 n=1 Tax=Homalodisca vitripennis TaxID=197043 RepID=UPI001EEA32D8|nr:uncharacterized protein LOC124365213 isoform X1 [Homalodisca vitripennis]XP_046677128.1 uncharacterized protein LOC124365213 isoform X1 [Homalodisca vitripennis]
MVDKLTTKCCWFFSLPVGSFLIGCYIVVSNFLGTVYLLDEADDRNLDWKFQLSYAIYGSAFISGVLLIIGIVILIGLFWVSEYYPLSNIDRYRIVQVASILFLICSVIRMVSAVMMVMESSFIAMFLITLFYFYGFMVLWSYCQEEAALEALLNLEVSPSQLKILIERFGSNDSQVPILTSFSRNIPEIK